MKDSLEYQYVILGSYGNCWAVTDGGTQKLDGLPSLLQAGWRPIRETPFHSPPYILILLEREAEPSKGFGFQS
ncbi:hypothetical protein BH23PLA1_BH23PLA1_44710 [soil metagenome]